MSLTNLHLANQIQEWLESNYEDVGVDDGKILFNAFILPLSNDLRGDIRRLQTKLVALQSEDSDAKNIRDKKINKLAQNIEEISINIRAIIGDPE